MPTIDEAVRVVKDSREHSELQQRILSYFQAHRDEVYRSIQKRELADKVGWRSPDGLFYAIINLAKLGYLGRLRVRGNCVFYGSHEAIEALRSRLPNESSEKGGGSDG